MPNEPRSPVTYTYRGGRKVALRERPDQLVVRSLAPEAAPGREAEQVSSASVRLTCEPGELEDLIRRNRARSVTHRAYELADSDEEFLITDRLLVVFREPLDAVAIGTFAGRYGLEILSRIDDRTHLFRLTDETGMNPVRLVVKLTEEDDAVELAEHDLNMRFTTQQIVLPSDPHYADQWHLHDRSQHPEVDPRSSARCEAAWQLLQGFGDEEVVVGVTDDGYALDHEDFDSLGKFAGWGYFQGTTLWRRGDPGADPDRMYETDANHGTACAAVIGAENDGDMTVGAAPGCQLLPIKWESRGPSLLISDSKMLTALAYLADRVDVLSNSWGVSPRSTWTRPVLDRIRDLAVSGGRRGKGILFLWAAGNENCPIEHQAAQDTPYTDGWELTQSGWRWIGVRTTRVFHHNIVGIPGVMQVAALASDARRSHYSNYGTGIDVCAPSSNSHAYFRMQVPGLGITTATGQSGGVRDDFGGTSSATPLAAAVAALVISANPEITAIEVASVLRRTASKDLDMAGYPPTPPANYDPDTSWDVSPIAPFDSGAFQDTRHPDGTWSPWFGHGKVDAFEAVQAVLGDVASHSGKVRIELAPGLAIPDREPSGVVSAVTVQESGTIRSLRVGVDIEHTYVGDLIVRLVGPDGTRADLHHRAGGRADDLVETYDVDSASDLSAFLGGELRGRWALEVSDHARFDVGVLRRWSLEAETQQETAGVFESSPGMTIPEDAPQGIEDRIAVRGVGTLEGIEVDLDVSHSWIGDLVVVLTSPAGKTVTLHQREVRSADDLR